MNEQNAKKNEYQQSDVTPLFFVLERMVQLHRNLVDLLNEELSHMVNLDTQGLNESAKTKEVLLNEIWNQEQLRIELIRTLYADEKMSLSTLEKVLPEKDKNKLKTLGDALKLLVEEAKSHNKRNSILAEDSLKRIEDLKKNVLGLETASSKEVYSSHGVRNPTPEQGGRLLSTEA